MFINLYHKFKCMQDIFYVSWVDPLKFYFFHPIVHYQRVIELGVLNRHATNGFIFALQSLPGDPQRLLNPSIYLRLWSKCKQVPSVSTFNTVNVYELHKSN